MAWWNNPWEYSHQFVMSLSSMMDYSFGTTGWSYRRHGTNKELEQVQNRHLSMASCLKRERLSVFWPGKSGDTEHPVLTCATCQSQQGNHPTSLWCRTKFPNSHEKRNPSTDFSSMVQRTLSFWIVTRFISYEELINVLSNKDLSDLKICFSTHGILRAVESDNETYIETHEFQNFRHKFGFDHIRLSPRYRKPNGEAERVVHLVKNLPKKCIAHGGDTQLGLQHLRNIFLRRKTEAPIATVV